MGSIRIRSAIAVAATLAVSVGFISAADAAKPVKPPKPTPTPTATATTTAPSSPSTPVYVALGDSYAAGNGAGSYVSDGTDCHRSTNGYPYLVAAAGGLELNLQACSGATIADVSTKQIPNIPAGADYVTITVGGNDIGFADTITTCLGTDTTACLNAVAAAGAIMASQDFEDDLKAVFTLAKTKASGAKVVATAYPLLFNGKDCSWFTTFTTAEMTALNNGAATLAGVIAQEASDAGIGYAEVRPPFVGHAICDPSAWINNLTLSKPSYEWFHPNTTGYSSGYTPSVKTALGIGGTSTTTSTLEVTLGGKTSSDTERGTVKIKTK